GPLTPAELLECLEDGFKLGEAALHAVFLVLVQPALQFCHGVAIERVKIALGQGGWLTGHDGGRWGFRAGIPAGLATRLDGSIRKLRDGVGLLAYTRLLHLLEGCLHHLHLLRGERALLVGALKGFLIFSPSLWVVLHGVSPFWRGGRFFEDQAPR